MRARVDRAAGGFVHPARLHADETVFDQIEPADAVLAAEIVERREQRGGRHRPAVPGNAVAPFDIDRSEERRVGTECVSTCRSRWSPSHYKNNEIKIK